VRRQMGNGAADRYSVDITIYHDDGRFAAAIEGLSVKLLPPEALEASIGINDTAKQSTVTHVTFRDTPTDDRAPTIRFQLNTASGEKRRALLVRLVREEAMKVLGVTDTIDPARPLREFGLDSLMSVTLANRLDSALGIGVSTVALIQGPSVDQIVDALLPELPVTDAAPVAIVTRPNPEHDTIVTSVSDEEVWLQPMTVQPSGSGPVWPIVDSEPPLEPVLPRSDDSSGKWINVVGPRPSLRLRLFCFPFAGGGSAVYQDWAQSIDPTIEVVAIEPPGRLGRITETPVADLDEFIDQLVPEMRDLLDRPFAFFGHCLGALTMYEATRRFGQTGMPSPEHLFVSGARPPDRINDQGKFEERLMQDLLKLAEYRISLPPYAQPDDVFAEIIRHFNIRATDELLNDPELRQLMLPVIRAEFQMASNYRFAGGPPLDIPITCFAAKGDPYVSRRQALGWGRFTNSRLQIHIREGAHFAVVEDAAFIQDVINRELETVSGSAQDLGAISPW
jgi:surfactin synthase thioesterase subunit/acyl carrier protein